MLRIPAGIFLALHGLVHLWYMVLAQKLVPYQPEMGWTGDSWALSRVLTDSQTRLTATVLYPVAALAFLVAAAGVLADANWRWLLVASAAFSTVVVALFWDGKWTLLVQKGLIAVIINIVVIVLALALRPSAG